MKRVFICSPLSNPDPRVVQANIARAHRLAYLACTLGEVAAFAPHGFYTAFLDDSDPEEREIGLHAGQRFLEICDELWCWDRLGITGGMQEEITYAEMWDVKVVRNPKCWAEGVDA